MPTIAQLPPATTVGPNDIVPVVQNGVTKNTTTAQLLAFFLEGVTSGGTSGPTFSGASINGQGHLILSRSDGATIDVGSVVGPAGTSIAGPGFTAATVTGAGHLVLTRTDGSTLDLGNVSSTLQLDGVTLATNSSGKVAVVGATPDSLSAASPTALGTATLVATIGGIDQKTTGAALVASQTMTINQLPVVSAPDLTDLIALYDVSGAVTGRVSLSALQSLLGTTSSGSSTATAPSQVGSLAAGTPTSTTVPLTWSAATGTAPITYTVQQSPHGANSYSTSAGSFGATGGTVTGLTASTSYDFQVVATNSAGSSTTTLTTGISSAVSSGTTPTYPALVFDSGAATFDTTTPMQGAASWTSQGKAVATIPMGSGNKFCIELLVRAQNFPSGDNTGQWLTFIDSAGNNLGINTLGTTLRAIANGNNGYYDNTANLYDGYARHLVTMDYDGTNLTVLQDGGYHASSNGASWVGGDCTLTIYGAIGPHGTGIDAIRISNISKFPTGSATYVANDYTGARTTGTVVCYNFDQQDGRGS